MPPKQEQNDEPNGTSIPNGLGGATIKLLEYRVTQLEQRASKDEQDYKADRARDEIEVQARRANVDKSIEKLEGDMQATVHRIDTNFSKLVIWATLVAGIVGFLAEHFAPWISR